MMIVLSSHEAYRRSFFACGIDNVSTLAVQCKMTLVQYLGTRMKKTLSRYGNSLALILDKPILELLNIQADTVLHITTDGEQLIITPERDNTGQRKNGSAKKDPRLQKIIDDVMEEFAEEFKKLADG